MELIVALNRNKNRLDKENKYGLNYQTEGTL